MKKIILGFFLLIVVMAVVLIGGMQYKMKYAKTEVTKETSEDGQYELIIYMIGEPEFPFGATHCRFVLNQEKTRISKRDFLLLDDGAVAREENFDIRWEKDSVIITVSGDEQADAYYQLYFDGNDKSWQEAM